MNNELVSLQPHIDELDAYIRSMLDHPRVPGIGMTNDLEHLRDISARLKSAHSNLVAFSNPETSSPTPATSPTPFPAGVTFAGVPVDPARVVVDPHTGQPVAVVPHALNVATGTPVTSSLGIPVGPDI